MSKGEEDILLLEKVKASNEAAFRQLFDKYYQKLCYTAYRSFPDEHKAKDFAQEVFLDLWRRRESIEIKVSLPAYLTRAVKNKAIDHVRAQRFNFGDESEQEDERENQPSALLEQEELTSLIQRTAEGLPERCKAVFHLSRTEGLSHKEIAAQLSISEKTVENQITKALKSLRKAVQMYFSEATIFLFFLSSRIGEYTSLVDLLANRG